MPKNPDLESVFGAGASRLAIEYLGPDIVPPSTSEDMVCSSGFVENSDKGGDCFPDQDQLSQVGTSEGSWTSAPKGKRAMRRERRRENDAKKLKMDGSSSELDAGKEDVSSVKMSTDVTSVAPIPEQSGERSEGV